MYRLATKRTGKRVEEKENVRCHKQYGAVSK